MPMLATLELKRRYGDNDVSRTITTTKDDSTRQSGKRRRERERERDTERWTERDR